MAVAPATGNEASRTDVQGFGWLVFLLADALFLGGLTFLFATRPRPADTSGLDVWLPLLAAACLLLAALLHRARKHLAWPFFGAVSGWIIWMLLWMQALDRGILPQAGAFALSLFLLWLALAIHQVAAIIVTGMAILKGRDARSTAGLGYFFVLLAVAAAAVGIVLAIS